MKFTIPFNMHAFLQAADGPATIELGTFVWGFRNNSPLIFTGIYKAYNQTRDRLSYTIELLDYGTIDVDGLIPIPGQLLPYVVARDNTVYRVQSVGSGTLTTTRGRVFTYDEVQPVLYRHSDEAKTLSDCMAKEPSEPDLPNRVREEGV